MNATATETININDPIIAEDIEDLGSAYWEAPERGAYPPDLKPGKVYEFTFHLQNGGAPEREPFQIDEVTDSQTQQKVKTLVVNFKGGYTLTLPSGDQVERTVGFQRASFYQSAKMKEKNMNSAGTELLRALGLKVEPLSSENVKDALRGADGRATFSAEVGWTRYDKEAKVSVSTHAQKKQIASGKAQPWPRNKDGQFEEFITLPSGGTKVSGNIEIVRFKLKT